MTIKDDVLNFLVGNSASNEYSNDLPLHTDTVVMTGLCVLCENRPHCVWVENSKLNCEHYE